MNLTPLYRNLLRAVLVLMFAVATVPQLVAQTDHFRQGTLPNGLRYYIFADKSTPGAAHYYLYQNVGAILENEQQQGLAHVLEHLAFNSTQHFPQGVMAFLRSQQLFDFEAYTGKDDTRFAVHNVPTDNAQLSQQMLFLLHDWCHGINFKPEFVEKERSIVIEEWRQRFNVDQRLSETLAPAVYNHSQYAHRNVIGTEKGLRTFKIDQVRKFYDTWYRPNKQFVAVIGDFDAAVVERQLSEVLSKLPNKQAPDEKQARVIESHDQPHFVQFVDAENASPSFGIYQRYATVSTPTAAADATRQFICTRLFNQLAPRRFARLRNEGTEQFIAAEVSLSSLVRGQRQMAWDVVPYEGQAPAALNQILALRQQLATEGFRAAEFEEAKTALYDGMKQVLESENLGTPDNLFDLCKQHFLFGEAITPFRQQIEANLEALIDLEVDDLNSWLAQLLDAQNITFATFGKNSNDLPLSAQQFAAALAQPDLAAVALSSPQRIEKIIDFDLPKGTIVAEKAIANTGAKEWHLSNGARVFYKYIPTDDKAAPRFFFVGSARGGRAAVAPAQLPDYVAMKELIMQKGVHRYNRNDLYEWLKNKDLDLTITPADFNNGIGGEAASAQADDFFAYLHLVLNRQRFDEAIFKKYIQRKRYLALNHQPTGMAAVEDSIEMLLTPFSPENPQQDAKFFEQARFEHLAPMFKQHFGRAEQFTFCLMGDLPEAEAKRLIEQYVASLSHEKTNPETLALRSLDFTNKAPKIDRSFIAKVEGDLGEIEMAFIADIALNDEEKAALEVFRTMLEHRYFEELREKAQATYSIAVRSDFTKPATPEAQFATNTDAAEKGRASLNIHFSTSRERVDEMKARAYEILQQMASGIFSDEEFQAAQIPLAVEAAEAERQNEATPEAMLWIGLLNVYADSGTLPNLPESSTTSDAANSSAALRPEETAFGRLTKVKVRDFVLRLLAQSRQRTIVVKSPAPEQRGWER